MTQQYFVSYYYRAGFAQGYGNIFPDIDGPVTESTVQELIESIKGHLVDRENMGELGLSVVILNYHRLEQEGEITGADNSQP